jgi:hypothetical protein
LNLERSSRETEQSATRVDAVEKRLLGLERRLPRP